MAPVISEWGLPNEWMSAHKAVRSTPAVASTVERLELHPWTGLSNHHLRRRVGTSDVHQTWFADKLLWLHCLILRLSRSANQSSKKAASGLEKVIVGPLHGSCVHGQWDEDEDEDVSVWSGEMTSDRDEIETEKKCVWELCCNCTVALNSGTWDDRQKCFLDLHGGRSESCAITCKIVKASSSKGPGCNLTWPVRSCPVSAQTKRRKPCSRGEVPEFEAGRGH